MKKSLFLMILVLTMLMFTQNAFGDTFTSYQTDFRDGVASKGAINDGGSTYSPGAWKWLGNKTSNVLCATGGITNYQSAYSAGIYNYSYQDDSNYIEISLPSDFPSGSYYVFVFGSTYVNNSLRFRVDDGPITQQASSARLNQQWYKIGQFNLTKDSKLRFSRSYTAGGVNMVSIQINTTGILPTNIPTGQEGRVYPGFCVKSK